MSDGNLDKQLPPTQDLSTTSDKKESARKSLFGNLNQDLKEALNSWDTLSETMSTKKSPDEEQLQEVKRLLGELQSKLKEFGE
ncbi:MAG TPA: hypothetical protein VGE46_04545 [Bdellovibrio sp.]